MAAEEARIELGVIGVSDDSARFGKYTGLDDIAPTASRD